jgi:anti-sigma factor (TIGR02949 family)
MNRRLDRTTCEEAFRRLDDYLDRRLTPDDMRLIEEHLHVCDACSREFTFEASVVKGVREKLRRVSAPADLLARISERIARTTDGEKPTA